MAFNGTEGEQITLAEASTMTANYRNANPNSVKGHFMGKEIIGDILAQAGCVGIRTYYGIDTNGDKQIIMVGVDANQNDMTTGIIADRTKPCPQLCGLANPLNS